MAWIFVLCTLVGGMGGAFAMHFIIKSHMKTCGVLVVDHSDPDDGPYLFLELATDPSFISKQSDIRLSVEVRNYVSQK